MHVDYVLIDSGSNSALFPLPTTPTLKFDIDSLIRNFPYDKFLWTIGTAHGVGLLPDTTLHIKPMADNGSSLNEIPCSLHTDIKPLTFAIPYIRFTLGNESMIVLTQTASIPFSAADRDILQTALTLLHNFEVQFPAMINAKRRAYCLYGQQFLKNVCSIQLNESMVFVDKQKLKHRLFPPQNPSMNEIANYLYFQRPTFSKTERFLQCEDDEHGGRDLFNVLGPILVIDEN